MRNTFEIFQKCLGGINILGETIIPTTLRDLFPTGFSGKLKTDL